MGFLSTLARQIKDKDDDEAMDIISRRTGINPPLPAPARKFVSVGDDPTPPPPATILPMPNRVNLASLGPPPGTGEYAINEMEDVLRSQQQYQPDLSNATFNEAGTISGARYPARAPALPMPTRTVATAEGVPPPPAGALPMPERMPRVFVGEDYSGMNPTQRATSHLRVLQGAAPESRVRDTGSAYEVEPPQKMSRLKAMGKGFLQLLGAGAPFGLGGMAGSGTVGAIQGLISPGSVQERGRQMEVLGAQEELARAQGLEAQRLQNDARRVQNASQIADLQNKALDRDLEQDQELRTEWKQGLDNIGEMQKRLDLLDPASAQYAAAEAAIKQEAQRLAKRTGRAITVIPGNRNLNKLPTMQIDGEVIQQQHDGSWRSVYGSPKSATDDTNADLKTEHEWRVKNTENEAKRTAATQEAESFIATAEDHQRKVTAARAEVLRIEGLLKGVAQTIPGVGPNAAYTALKAQRDQAERIQNDEQGKMDAAYKQANQKRAEASQYPTLPPPPKRVRRGAGTPPPPPGVTEASVRAEAKRRGQNEDDAVRRAREWKWIP